MFDEAHNVVTSTEYRESYEACVKQNFKFVKVVFLSGSLTMDVKASLLRTLSHIKDSARAIREIITTKQSRDEIYMHFQPVTSDQNFQHLHWIINLMHNWRNLTDISSFPQFLIYVYSLSNLRDLFNWFQKWCPDPFRNLIMKYCKSMGDEESKKNTIDQFREGKLIKVLLTSKLAGEGLNFMGLNIVIIQG